MSMSSMSRTNTDMGPGRRIINVGPTQSNLVAGRSARPGDPAFDQNFGGTMNNTFARAATQHDIEANMRRGNLKTPYFEHAAAPTTTSQGLRGGIGANPGDASRGDGFHGVASLAAQRNQTQDFGTGHDIAEQTPQTRTGRHGGNSQTMMAMNKSNVHNQSQQSLVGSSGEYHAAGGRPPMGATAGFDRTQSAKVDDSTAALGRPPTHIEGLTEFLRKEYYRRMGIYLNGGRKEFGLLFNFWKDHVSETYRQLNEQKKKEMRDTNAFNRMKELQELSKRDPALYRKKMAEKEAKDQTQLEQQERAEKIQARQATQCRYHKKPVPNCKACERGSQRSSNRPGTAQAARRPSSAVPEVKTGSYGDYELYKNCFEMDVVKTINDDLEEAAQYEKLQEMNYMQSRQKAMEKSQNGKIDQIVDQMLQLYFLLDSDKPPADAVKKEEKKKISPSKQAAQPARPSSAAPPKATVSRAQMDQTMKESLAQQKKPLDLKADMSKYPKEAVDTYNFFTQLFKMVRQFGSKVMVNDSYVVTQVYLEPANRPQFAYPASENQAKNLITDFFKPENFLKRLRLHREYICKSKTKKQQLLQLYYIEIPQRERQVNLIDCTPADKQQSPDGTAIIQQEAEHARKAEEQKEKERQEKLLAKQTKAELNKKRLNEIAKPKDKWKVGKELLKMQKEFPHDRVLQRMVQEEFKANQTFRYPDEYDKYNQEEEKKMKHLVSDETGCKRHDYEDGEAKLGIFQVKDKLDYDKQRQTIVVSKRQQIAFEKDLITDAQAYTKEASKRLTQESGQRKTYRRSLAEIYKKMQEKHPLVIEKHYKLQTYGMKEGSETMKKAYPESFKRYFFRLIKTLNGKPIGKMTNKDVYKGAKRLPTTFMVAGTSKRCTIHEFSCPTHPCPYRTHNKKIVMTENLARKNAESTMATRSRIFYRDDYKKQMPNIFMSNDDQLNCRFEPMTGSLNPNFWNERKFGAVPEKCRDTAESEKAFCDKLGVDFEKAAPEIYKKGVLKKAIRKYRGGEFQAAMNQLMQGFKISSLKRNFDPDFEKKQQKKEEEKAAEKARGKKPANDLMRLETMKEDPDEQQKNMSNEQVDNAKLIPILKDAYDLICLIEEQEAKCRKEIKNLEKQKQNLKAKQNKIQQLNSIDAQATVCAEEPYFSKELFKTIMCPLLERCPNDCRPRWHKSGERTTMPFGKKCPYAHHYMELEFPQTLKTKISAITKMQTTIHSQIESKRPGQAFIPTGTITDCKGGCFTTKCNQCKYKSMAGLIITDLDDTSIRPDAKTLNLKKKSASARVNAEAKESVDFLSTKKKIDEELKVVCNDLDLDEAYCRKFGLLKKASILTHYDRDKDAKKYIADAAAIVQKQRKAQEERQEAIEARWKFKLGLDDGFELPDKVKKKHPNDVTDKDLKEVEMPSKIKDSVVRLYIEKVSPWTNNQFNKNVYLDQCIEDLYKAIEAKKVKKHDDIEKMKKNIEKLQEIAEAIEDGGEEGVEQNLDDEDGQGIKFKPRKTTMCQETLKLTMGHTKQSLSGSAVVQKEIKCKQGKEWKFKDVQEATINYPGSKPKDQEEEEVEESKKKASACEVHYIDKSENKIHKLIAEPRKCKGAHNPIELELIPVTKKIQNLKGVVSCQSRQLHQNMSYNDWKPGNKYIGTDMSVFAPYVDTKADLQENEEDADKPKSIFDREDLHKDPLEEKD